MLTKEYLKDNFITAYFCDDDRKFIEILTTSEDKKETYPTVIPFDENEPQYKILLEFVTLDQLHEITHKRKQEERKLFEEQIMRIAEKDGMIMQGENETNFWPKVVKSIIEDTENEDHLFALKLALFEVEKIRDSENIELKGAIRKSKTKAEVLLNALKLILE